MTITKNQENKIIKVFHMSKLSPLAKEIGLFAGIFASVFVISIAFVNANLLYHTVRDVFQPVQANEYAFTSDNISNLMHDKSELQTFLQDGNDSIDTLKKEHTMFVASKQKIEAQLQNKDYDFSYSLVPPGNRIFIPSIWVDAPIVDINSVSEDRLKHGQFDAELFSGVVKYPSTPEPWHKGNTLIFGHTSYYRWKKNPYGEVFAKIYDLKKWDAIKVARKWQLYEYEIVESKVVKPTEVDATYMQFTNWEYITLMGCYPIWTDSRRWLIIAKRKDTEKKPSFALSQ